jgi:hypothetical protein
METGVNRMDESIVRSGFEPGTIIAGKYRIDRWLAEGGMGFVVAGTHLHLDQPVALKFLRQGMSLQPEALARFTREGKAAALLRSEYVARVFDAGVTAEGMPYMAMEYLEGESLALSLQRQGVLDVSSAAEYIIQACEGLAEAHSRAIVHRDIKPYNLFLVERAAGWRAIKVLDFGISKASFADATHIATSSIIGSPCYMSPEQLRSSASVDHRTDIWSLGATLYELLGGKSAFDAYLSLPEIIASILANPAPDVRELRPDVPQELAAIIVRCLAKNRHVRFQSAGELATALLPFAPPRAHVPAERAASMAPTPPVDRGLNVATGSFPMLPGGEGQWLDFAESLGGRATRTEFAVRGEERGPTKMEPGGSTAPLALSVAGAETLENSEEQEAAAPERPTRGWVAASAIALGVGAVLVSVLVGTRAGATKAATITAANASPPASAALPDPGPVARLAPLQEEAERVELVVRVSPPQSRLTVDDQPVENPYRVTYPKDGPSHSIEARAWGYEPRSEVVSLARDTVVDLALERHVEWSPPAPRANRVTPESSKGARGSATAAAPAKQDITSAGGHSPLRPIEVNDPYGAQ